jgi:hypothetical protein
VAPFGITLFSTDGWGPKRHGDMSNMPVVRNPGSALSGRPSAGGRDPTLSAPDDLLFADGVDARSVWDRLSTALSAGERANMSATTLNHWLFPDTYRTKISRPWGHA